MKKNFRLVQLVFLFVLLCSLMCVAGCTLFENKKSGNNEKQSYNVAHKYFNYISFKPTTFTIANIKEGTTTYEYAISITSSCVVSLYKYQAEVALFSANGTEIYSESITKEQTISAQNEFSFDLIVGIDIQAQTSSVKVTYSGKSYENPQSITTNNTEKYKVTFVYNNGSADMSVTVSSGETVSTPTDPTKTNYIFIGWYIDKTLTAKYDFSLPVESNFTLYAAYELDAVTITNKISQNTIHGMVKIYNKSYNTFLGFETSSTISQGSGFCFKISSGYYYVLTNCHVAKKDSSYSHQEITIEDYQGKKYTGYIYQNPKKSYSAISASYDLACLYFKPSSTNVTSLVFGSNPDLSADVVSLGAPQGQTNFITYGNVNLFRTVTLNTSTDLSNVKFEVIEHTAYIDHGSSGGPLLNSNLQVVGVNYAVNDKTQSIISRSYAIPVSKVQEFLKSYVYN